MSDFHEGKYTFRAKGAENEAVLTVCLYWILAYVFTGGAETHWNKLPTTVIETNMFIFQSGLWLFCHLESPKSDIFNSYTLKLANLY